MTHLDHDSAAANGAGTVTYRMTPTAPPIHPMEFEGSGEALEVMVLWGDSLLHVTHRAPGPFSVGEALDARGNPRADFVMGADSLGVPLLPITVENAATGLAVVIPAGADGYVELADHRHTGPAAGQDDTAGGRRAVGLSALRAQGRLRPSHHLAQAHEYDLRAGSTVALNHLGFTFIVRSGAAARVIGRERSVAPDRAMTRYLLGSLGMSALLLLLFYLLPPSASTLSLDLLQADDRYASYLATAASVMEPAPPDWLDPGEQDQAGEPGERHLDAEGQAGKRDAPAMDRRLAVRKRRALPPQLSTAEAKEMAAEAGIIGLLKGVQPRSPTSPYGAAEASGNHAINALGAILGGQVGDNFGFGGLGPRGTGRGGGGRGLGTVGLGKLGTLGRHGNGTGPGYGHNLGGLRPPKTRVPRIRSGKADIRGSLSKEVIRRVIRRHVNEVRYCYEQGLSARPDLDGRVRVKFIIAPSGEVAAASVAHSTLGQARVEQCIAQAVRRWSFPAPDGGIVVVTYPFVLSRVGG